MVENLPESQNLKNFSQILNNEITKAKRILMFFHENPDLDSIGSNYALHDYCRIINPDANIKIFSLDIPNGNLRHLIKLYGKAYFEVKNPINVNYEKDDLVLLTDISDISRATLQKDFTLPDFVKIISIDHHRVEPKHETFYLNFENQSASSIVYELFKLNNFEISKNTFRFIIMGIVGDSGFFRFKDNKFVQTLNCIKEMVEKYGKDSYYDLIGNLEKNQPIEDFYFKKIFLKNLVISKDYAYTFVTNKDREENKIPKDYVLINGGASFIKNLGNSKFIFTITQDVSNDNIFYLSFRSCAGSGFIVRTLAEKLGGGGHDEAAGAQIKALNIDEVKSLVLSAINELA